ncbi:MAG: family 16 glycoside hydrolase [Planctomycetota bacterium]
MNINSKLFSVNLLLAICFTLSTHLHLAIHAQEPTEEQSFESIFDGKSLAGWHGDNPHTTAKAKTEEARNESLAKQAEEFSMHWQVEGDELVNDGKGPYATTDREFGDIELQLEYKTVPKADSGIYLRGTPQVQIWDTTEAGGKWNRNANYGSGGLFNNTKGATGQLPLMLADEPFGQWNQFRIVQVGSRTWVELNGKLVVNGAIMENYWERDKPLPASGPIHLQTHGGEIRWRNINIREINANEAIAKLRSEDGKEGFTSIFNGKNLQGWTGAVDDYEVHNGSLRCKPGRGGVLYTDEVYENFVTRIEFKLPPGGNNGLAIRYPGHGRASYDGMCELQVLDNEHPKYAKLDPRQYHGSIYGIAAAHRGYLRPAGQWNYQEVTVDGGRIQVELNGTVIVDVNVDTIQPYKASAAHPGVHLRRGHFGFAGHNDPVEFRNIAIKRLPASAKLREVGTVFEASFDDVTDANLSTGDGFLLSAKDTKRDVMAKYESKVMEIASGEGVYGDALRFLRKPNNVYFYEGNEVDYREENWSGSVSLWMKVDPDQDLEPGFVDPLQITAKKWNDASIFIDFDKKLPRDFRLGVFPDYDFWNPNDTPWEKVAPEQRPMIVVKNPPFSSKRWTHVCFTWHNINAKDGSDAVAKLFLNGKHRGSMQRPIKFTWNPEKIATMIGIGYTGMMDNLLIYPRALTPPQVHQIYAAGQMEFE